MQMWNAHDLYPGVTITDGGGSLEITNVERQSDGYVYIEGIRTDDGEPDGFEVTGDTSVNVTSF